MSTVTLMEWWPPVFLHRTGCPAWIDLKVVRAPRLDANRDGHVLPRERQSWILRPDGSRARQHRRHNVDLRGIFQPQEPG